MSQAVPSTEKPLRMSVETFRARQEAGEAAVTLDVRGQGEWDLGDTKLPGALRAYPEIEIDPRWPKNRLILAY